METIKQHYIPQFILRNFCVNDNRIDYYNKEKNRVESKSPKEIFFMRNIYRDEINYKNNPDEIEKMLSDFENEAARLINGKIRDLNEIKLTFEENDKLRFFLAVMSLRNKMTADVFKKKLSEKSKGIFGIWQKDKNFEDLWKRNLGNIIKCRSIQEVHESKNIDLPFKYFILRDGYVNYEGHDINYIKSFNNINNVMKNLSILPYMYFVILERRGEENFSLGDSFAVMMNGVTDNGKNIHMYSIFPISYKRILLLVTNGAVNAPDNVRVFDKSILKQPSIDSDNNLVYLVRKIYSKDVEEINNAIRENAQYGYII